MLRLMSSIVCLFLFLFVREPGLEAVTTPLQPITVQNAGLVTEVATWSGAPTLISNARFSPVSNILTVVGVLDEVNPSLISNGEIIFLDPTTLEQIELVVPALIGTTFAYSPDGTLLAVGTESGVLTVYRLEDFEFVMSAETLNSHILSVAIDPANQYVAATFGTPATLMEGEAGFKVFTISSGDEYLSLPCANMTEFGCDGPFGTAVAFDTTGETVFLTTTYGDDSVRAWNLESREEDIVGGEANVLPRNLIYTQDWLGYIALDNEVRLLNFSGNYRALSVPPVNQSELEAPIALAAHPTETLMAVSYSRDVADNPNRDAVLRLWDTTTGEVLKTMEITTEQDDPIWALAFDSTGTLLATGSGDGTIRLWGVPAGGE